MQANLKKLKFVLANNKTPFTTSPCISASVPSTWEQASPGPTVQLDGAKLRWSLCKHCGCCSYCCISSSNFSFVFEESHMIHLTLMISVRFFPVHGGSLWWLWKLFSNAAVLGRVCDVPQRLYQYTAKRKQEMQLQLSSCLVLLPLISLAFEEFPLGSTYDHIFYSGSMLPPARWPLATKQLRATLKHESWHELWSQNCLPVPPQQTAKEPISASAGTWAATARLCLSLLFHGLSVPVMFGDTAQMLSPHITLPLLHKLPAVKPYPAEYHVFDINYMSEPHESHWNLMRCRDGTTEPMAFIKGCHGDQFARLDPH